MKEETLAWIRSRLTPEQIEDNRRWLEEEEPMDILDVEARPPRLQAVQVTQENLIDVASWALGYAYPSRACMNLLDGDDSTAYIGDWVVYNPRKDKYKVVKDGEFQERYAKVEEG